MTKVLQLTGKIFLQELWVVKNRIWEQTMLNYKNTSYKDIK